METFCFKTLELQKICDCRNFYSTLIFIFAAWKKRCISFVNQSLLITAELRNKSNVCSEVKNKFDANYSMRLQSWKSKLFQGASDQAPLKAIYYSLLGTKSAP